jgi:hypothetical protein
VAVKKYRRFFDALFRADCLLTTFRGFRQLGSLRYAESSATIGTISWATWPTRPSRARCLEADSCAVQRAGQQARRRWKATASRNNAGWFENDTERCFMAWMAPRPFRCKDSRDVIRHPHLRGLEWRRRTTVDRSWESSHWFPSGTEVPCVGNA